jgi:small subunit ribosomal protein S1
MSDSPVPAPAPEPQPAAPAEQKPAAPLPQGRSNAPHRPFPRGGGPGGNRGPREDRPRQDRPQGPPPERRDFTKPSKHLLDQSIEEELKAALAGLDVGTTLENPETPVRKANEPKLPGGRKRGRIVSIRGKDVFIDVPGGRGQGVLQILHFDKPPVVGEEVDFSIERYDAANGLLLLTREGASQAVSNWFSLSLNMIVDAKVTGVNQNKTGLLVEVNGIKGFMPVSQIDIYRTENPEQFIGQTLKCEVIELDREERNLILSKRAIQEREKLAKAEEFWAKIQEGETRTGIVRNVKPFGVFVDLDGADGLIPVGELSWSRVNDPNELVKVGQRVEVQVKKVDRDTRRIGLSLRHLQGNPWDDFTKENRPGTRVRGKVTRLMEFGAFVELAPGIEGLIHISELSTDRVRRVRDVVGEGQDVDVQILNIDSANRRIGLSLKTIMAGEQAIAEAAAEAERLADAQAATERMANRPANPNLRGGIGSGKPLFSAE